MAFLFAPAYADDITINIYGCEPIIRQLKTALATQMEPSYFPVAFNQLKANVIFKKITENNFKFKNATFSYIRNNHPGNAFCFRVSQGSKK